MAVKPTNAIAVVQAPLHWRFTAQDAGLLVRGDEHAFALIGRWAGGGALIGSEPVRVARPEEDPFELLDSQPPVLHTPAVTLDGHPEIVGGGWFGWLGYELGRRLEPVGAGPPSARRAAAFQLAYYDHLLHLAPDGRWWFEALWTRQRARALRARLREFQRRAANRLETRSFSTAPWRATPTTAGHALAVEACRERIRAGDLYQANVCVRLESRLQGDPLDVFLAACSRLQPDRGAFLSAPERAVASISPELFLERQGRRVRSAPIKGTRPRPADARLAARERQSLAWSEKDRAENVMIVDLVRNDLGRVCVPGSIHVDALTEPRPHAGVWHLVSEVSGRLREGIGDAELVRAAFPPGSVTGAPKVAAMNVIAELESSARELYTGAIGFASPLAGLELSVAIRTFEFSGDRAWLGVGGGIVADSKPLGEAAECATKAAPLLAAIGATLRDEPARPAPPNPPPPPRLAPHPVPRPEPAAGVFETLLVLDGRPVALEQHLWRLRSSVVALYGVGLPAGLEQELLAAARPLDRARMRVDVRPEGPAVATEIGLDSLPRRRAPVRLAPITVPGGLGPHKWSDRRLLAALSREADGQPLLCDLDGVVLEAARANLFIVEDGPCIVTPPADGRILPGVSRAAVLELARSAGLEARVEAIELGRVVEAREIFLTGSLGGVEPAVLDSCAPSGGAVTDRLARGWHAWARASSSGQLTVHGERLPA